MEQEIIKKEKATQDLLTNSLSWKNYDKNDIYDLIVKHNPLLNTQAAKDWFKTITGSQWLASPFGRKWLSNKNGAKWLNTKDGTNWSNQNNKKYSYYSTQWLKTSQGKEWLKSENGQKWLFDESIYGGSVWCGLNCDAEFNQSWIANNLNWSSSLGHYVYELLKNISESDEIISFDSKLSNKDKLRFLMSEKGYEWLTNDGVSWLNSQEGSDLGKVLILIKDKNMCNSQLLNDICTFLHTSEKRKMMSFD